MIVEQRTYRVRPGSVREYLRTYEHEGGLALQRKYLGRLVGYFHTEFGALNQIVHLWAYDDLQDREARRAALSADPQWQEYAPKIFQFIEAQESKILKPAAFSPHHQVQEERPCDS
ncbi:NIPSNAP family protein [Variovorax sp. J22R133]|uniref:NIPSNAP family protein n=1 Tax=Variovorax brevis TaxID=3053503 RepID=UPI002576FA39|nr:NIPSNAP family protein [Variovorax sp. J22R133]MDM0117354.1 NIPSNAP family protein [Variovorax sp. J22R133]